MKTSLPDIRRCGGFTLGGALASAALAAAVIAIGAPIVTREVHRRLGSAEVAVRQAEASVADALGKASDFIPPAGDPEVSAVAGDGAGPAAGICEPWDPPSPWLPPAQWYGPAGIPWRWYWRYRPWNPPVGHPWRLIRRGIRAGGRELPRRRPRLRRGRKGPTSDPRRG